MHPSLRLEALTALRVTLRGIATRAAKGSPIDLARVSRRLEVQPELSTPFLPILFARLDPALIPDRDLLDTSHPPQDIMSLFSTVFTALVMLSHLCDVPSAALCELWRRLWTWTEVLEAYPYCVRTTASAEDIRVQLLPCWIRLLLDRQVDVHIHNSPGVHAFFARTWTGVKPGQDFDGPVKPLVWTLSSFMRTSDWNTSDVEEFVSGSELTVTELATLLVEHVHSISRWSKPLTWIRIYHLAGVLTFARSTQKEHPAIFRQMFSAGLTAALTRALVPVHAAQQHETEDVLGFCLRGLHVSICGPTAYPYLPEAINAGLLHAIVILGQTDAFEDVLNHLQIFVRSTLPGALIYRHVVSALACEVSKMVCPSGNKGFVKSSLYVDWQAFVALLQERVVLLNDLKSPHFLVTNACDGPRCGIVKPASEFKCCSGCKLHYYCSQTCQTAAWRSGDHRLICKTLRDEYNPHEPVHARQIIGRRDEVYLRLALHHEHRSRQLEIILMQLVFIRRFPGTPFLTVFDYTKGRCSIHVAPLSSLSGDEGLAGNFAGFPPEFATGLQRVILDGGKTVDGAERTSIRCYVIPSWNTEVAAELQLLLFAHEILDPAEAF
ncbi:hypothetical protein C8R43DRAFT_1105418 [Mycena crocata]|nr:hypothetical protein C8R43DRAFT_1105418 [Mycena crocata]